MINYLQDALITAQQQFADIWDELLTKQFVDYTVNHINLVNEYANKVDLDFPTHDSSKLTLLLPGYRYLLCEDKTPQQEEMQDICTQIHVTQASHHPEYWVKDRSLLQGFTRKNPNPHGMLDCSHMPQEAIDEMCADWCAMSKHFDNTPFEWFDKVNGTRWYFNNEQQMYIRLMLDKMWN